MSSKKVLFIAVMLLCVGSTAFGQLTLTDWPTMQMITDISGNPLGWLDVTNNPQLIHELQTATSDDGPWMAVPDNTAAIGDYLAVGYNGGDWLGITGITSENSATNAGYRGLGYLSGEDFLAYNSDFYGVVPAATDALIKYTYVGDFTLDGTVDDTDLIQFLGYYSDVSETPVTKYFEGDLTFDNIVNDDDLIFFLGNYSDVSPLTPIAGGGIAPVPEPSTLILLGIGIAIGLITIVKKRIA